jgi:hypothetical protein
MFALRYSSRVLGERVIKNRDKMMKMQQPLSSLPRARARVRAFFIVKVPILKVSRNEPIIKMLQT